MSKAIMCDKCGKIMLLDDDHPYAAPAGLYRLICSSKREEIDLCDECGKELTETLRTTRGESE